MTFNKISIFVLMTFLLLLILIVSCRSELKQNNVKPQILRIEIATDDDINKDIDSIYKVYFESGNLKYQVGVKDNERHGEEIEYYENGNVKMRGSCIKGYEHGFYFYYNMEGSRDSIVEYITIDTDNPFQSFIHPNKFSKREVVANRILVFDENNKLSKAKSLYFDVDLQKDTVNLNDTIFARLRFIYQTNNQSNNFKIYYSLDNLGKAIESNTVNGSEILYFSKIANQKGVGGIKGIIEEEIGSDGKVKYWFFEKKYYVK